MWEDRALELKAYAVQGNTEKMLKQAVFWKQ